MMKRDRLKPYLSVPAYTRRPNLLVSPSAGLSSGSWQSVHTRLSPFPELSAQAKGQCLSFVFVHFGEGVCDRLAVCAHTHLFPIPEFSAHTNVHFPCYFFLFVFLVRRGVLLFDSVCTHANVSHPKLSAQAKVNFPCLFVFLFFLVRG